MKYCAQHDCTRGGLLIGLSLLLCGALAGQDKPKLSSIGQIQVAVQNSVTKVIVSVNGLIDIQHDQLENPPRYFVDFAATIPALGGKGPRGVMQAIAGAGPILKQVRVAENQKGVTRLVFDLETAEVDFRTIVLKDPNRLVVELRRKSAPSGMKNPLATAPPTVSRAEPRIFRPLPTNPPNAGKSIFRMAEPPILAASTFKLPKAEPSQMPYRVSGFVLRDFQAKLPLNSVGRQAERSQAAGVAATRLSAGKQSLTRVLGLKIGRVVIDPGHGGHDAGSIGPTGLMEKDVTLDISRRLASLLEAELSSEVVLTRKDDAYISPEQRTVIANQQHADLFISIHANSSTLKSATGVETYYLNFTSSPEALEVAARENASSQKGVGDLGDLIKKIALKDKIDESREFASRVQQSLFSGSAKAGNRTKDRGVRKAPFIVLIGAEMPSVLTEIGFLSNPREEALLRKPEYRQKIAEALYRGISQYAGTLSHFNLAQTGASGQN
ncbi:MAG: AMIN domain-containing protein [Acidobacteria bacterium]|nr:AMIN domain-containing protein [Acidobacteriota bacterium]